MKDKVIIEILDYVKLLGVVLLITTLLNTLVFTFSTVQQSSMEHTLMEGDVLVIEKVTLLFNPPEFGDIIVFVENEPVAQNYFKKLGVLYQDMLGKLTRVASRTRLVKRVIGVPGDIIDIKDGRVYVNDKLLQEAYVEDLTFAKVLNYPVTVPDNAYFVMGDNRDVSRDSRHFGMISLDHIEGKAIFRLSPFKNFGQLE